LHVEILHGLLRVIMIVLIRKSKILHLKTIVVIGTLTYRLIISRHWGSNGLGSCENLQLFLSKSSSMHIVEIIQENFFKLFGHWFEITNQWYYFVQKRDVSRLSDSSFNKSSFRLNCDNQQLSTTVFLLWIKFMKLFFNSHLFVSALGTIAFR
jgi:hypothetical protein